MLKRFTCIILVFILLLCEPVCAKSKSKYSGKYSDMNIAIAYNFLREKGHGKVQACAIVANMLRECGGGGLYSICRDSDLTPTCTYGPYYGILQWGYDRRTDLINYCNRHGYSVSSLKGQLNYLHYSLTNINAAHSWRQPYMKKCKAFPGGNSAAHIGLPNNFYTTDSLYAAVKAFELVYLGGVSSVSSSGLQSFDDRVRYAQFLYKEFA